MPGPGEGGHGAEQDPETWSPRALGLTLPPTALGAGLCARGWASHMWGNSDLHPSGR